MDQISIDDFKKLDIRMCKIIEATKVEGADKLLKLILDVGAGEHRQILSGIAEVFTDPSVLVGKTIPVLLNLAPRTMKGEVSNGMMLCADSNGIPTLLFSENEVPPGSMVK
jgi:methionyl-tRNA synthetase